MAQAERSRVTTRAWRAWRGRPMGRRFCTPLPTLVRRVTSLDLSSSRALPRLLQASVGSVFVLDTARDGRWLVTRDDTQLSIRALLPGGAAEREFAWLGSALDPHLSQDGKLLLFFDVSQSAGANYAVSLRKTDGSAVVRLGEGAVAAFSPDATRALAQVFNPPQIVIYPIGPGEPIRLKPGPLERVVPRRFFPDGKRVIVCGNEPSRPFRCYGQDLMGGLPTPLTPEGLDVSPVAPDGRSVVTIGADRAKQVLSLDVGRPSDPRGDGG